MNFFGKYPLFLFLLPVFFVFHGFIENYASVTVKDALLLVLAYMTAGLLIALLFFWYYKDFRKAAFTAFLLLAFNFFFGSVQDFLKYNFEGSFIARYSFILPFSFILIFLFIILIKRKNKGFRKLILYLNILFMVLLLMDLIWLMKKKMEKNWTENSTGQIDFSGCDTCYRPDIYFIILDAYSGNNTLKRKFDFDNSGFEDELRGKGFYVAGNSKSNYNYTPFSLASILNMQYLELDMKTKGAGNLNYCYQMIRESSVIQFLKQNGYEFLNYSIFDFPGQSAVNSDDFISTKTKLITSQTFISRVWKDISFNITTGKWNFPPLQKRIIYSHLHNNNQFIRLTSEAARTKKKPKMVYTHLMMPHYPYYFDSKGKQLPLDSLGEDKKYNKKNYIGYLQYCNGEIMKLCETIFQSSSSPPIIILASDHGFRFSTKQENKQYCFNNLCAVYLPSGKYSAFYDSLSSVNLFPIILNTQFQQTIPIKKDSTIYLWD